MGSENGQSNEGSATMPSTPQTPFTPLPLLKTSRNAANSSAMARESICGGGEVVVVAAGGSSGGGGARKASSIILGQCFAVDHPYTGGGGGGGGGGGEDHPSRSFSFSNACVNPPVPSVSLTRKVGAELVGTFILMFVATAAVVVDEATGGSLTVVGNAAAAGLAVMAVILSVGHISGAHLNPCLTLSFAALRQFPWPQVPAYLAAQVVGSICASFALKGIFQYHQHPELHGGVTVPSGSDAQSFVLELVISFNLMFVVTAVATDTRAVGELAAIAVGATVMMNILISGATSGGSMNPVRTLGPAIAANNYKGLWLYMVGPPLGALCGATAYALIRLSDDDPGPSRSSRSFRRSTATTPR